MDYYWKGGTDGTGYWRDAVNWNPNSVPISHSSDKVYITNTANKNAAVHVGNADDFGTNRLSIYGTGAQTAALSISGGSVSCSGLSSEPLTVGINGIINQTGGMISGPNSNNFLNINAGGTYNLGAGNLRGGILDISGVFNQTGGAVQVKDMGAFVRGVYNLTNGSLNTDVYALIVNGAFSQYGGLVQAGAGFHVSGTYNLLGGDLHGQHFGAGESKISDGGTLNYSGGNLIIQGVDGYMTNDGTVNISGGGTRTIGPGYVVNNGLFKVTGTTVVYSGTFTNNGAYISDPARNCFHNLLVGKTGYLSSGDKDEFHISGDFLNHSQNSLWNTAQSDLFFGAGSHMFFIGEAGLVSRWDNLTLEVNTKLKLKGDAALHVNTLNLFDIAQLINPGRISYDKINIISSIT